MKIIYIVLILVISFSCKSQEKHKINKPKSKNKIIMDTIKIKRLDIDYLKKNGQKIYYFQEGVVLTEVKSTDTWNRIYYQLEEKENDCHIHTQGDEKNGFFKKIKYLLFYENLFYDNQGILVNQKKESIYGFLIEEKEYDKQGNVVKFIDYDNEFKFKWKNVKEYLNSIGVETAVDSFVQYPSFDHKIRLTTPIIERDFNNTHKYEKNVKKLWFIHGVKTEYKGAKGIFYITLDGDTGEELLVRQLLGKKSGKKGVGTRANFKVLLSKMM